MPLYNPPVIVENSGAVQGAVNTINFTGSAHASVIGNIATINVAGSSVVITQVEVDFGTTPISTMAFTVIDSNVSPTSLLMINQSGSATSDHAADENELDPILFSGDPGTGQFTLFANALNGPVVGKYRANYIVG